MSPKAAETADALVVICVFGLTLHWCRMIDSHRRRAIFFYIIVRTFVKRTIGDHRIEAQLHQKQANLPDKLLSID